MRRPEIAATRGTSATVRLVLTVTAALAIGCGGTTGSHGNPDAPLDAGASDATMQDANGADALDLDAGPVDEGADFDVAIVYADAARLPDVVAPPADGSDAGTVLPTCGDVCEGSEGGVCTPTECLLYHQSPDCYECLFQGGCIDDAPPPASFGDSDHECQDLTVPGADGGPMDAIDPLGITREQRCLDVIQCTLAHSSAQPVLAFGYCGMQPTTTSCQTATPGQTGPCLAEEQAGLETVDPNTVLARYTNTMFGGGMANQLFQCAIANTCLACLGAPDAGH
jgi:hypothetical protein